MSKPFCACSKSVWDLCSFHSKLLSNPVFEASPILLCPTAAMCVVQCPAQTHQDTHNVKQGKPTACVLLTLVILLVVFLNFKHHSKVDVLWQASYTTIVELQHLIASHWLWFYWCYECGAGMKDIFCFWIPYTMNVPHQARNTITYHDSGRI